MKKEIAMKWADALESGDYKQTTGTLRDGDSFCCLGVLCNLHAQSHPWIAAQEKNMNEYMGKTAVPPLVVKDWAGMNRFSLLSTKNDYGASFAEIAKFIRENWKHI